MEVLDSRGNPTVRVTVITQSAMGIAYVPSGASTGEKEALELRDGDERYRGKGVQKAVNNILKKIRPEIVGRDVRAQPEIDSIMIEMDGSEDKSSLGANAILGVSLALAKCAADALGGALYRYLGSPMTNILPVPYMNVINGGEHAGNTLDIQEHMIVPVEAESYSEALRKSVEVFHTLGDILKNRYGAEATNVGDEGGYAPPMNDPYEPFELMNQAIEESGYVGEIVMAVDSAASEFCKNGDYIFNGKNLRTDKMIEFYQDLIEKYPIISIEDPLDEDDWDGFRKLTEEIGNKVQLVGDDIFVSNPRIIEKGIKEEVCNAVLLKVNQIGTLTEAMKASDLAMKGGYEVMVSHRSGETCDPLIADLAVALSCGQIKTGAPCRGERVAKYNRLLEIERELGDLSVYGK